MMYCKVFRDVLGQEKTLQNMLKKLFLLVKYYNNLNKGISSGRIYHEIKNQDPMLVQVLDKLTEDDHELLHKLFHKDVKEFLQKTKLKTHLDFNKKIGFDQVGYNTIYVHKPTEGLWTTGKASFYMPCKKDFNTKVALQLESIPPLKVTIGFDNVPIKTINIPKLSNKKVEFVIKSSNDASEISEIFISTDKLWLPNVILETEESVTLGISVKSIDVTFF